MTAVNVRSYDVEERITTDDDTLRLRLSGPAKRIWIIADIDAQIGT